MKPTNSKEWQSAPNDDAGASRTTRWSPAVLSVLTAATALAMQGCVVVGVEYEEPASATPDAWTLGFASDVGRRSSLKTWWKEFRDPVLDDLVELTRAANPDLKAAAQRIAEARAQRGAARSQLLPEWETGTSYARRRSSESLLVNPGDLTEEGFDRSSSRGVSTDFYTAGFDAGWELDLFGGLRRSVESADASVDASIEAYRDLLVTLLAETALNYTEYRTLEARLQFALSNIKAQQDSVELTRSRLEAGLVSRIDVTQAQTNLETSRSLIPQLRTQLALARNRLATLTATDPSAMEAKLGHRGSIPLPDRGFSAGLPCDLIRSRPDIRQAERELAAQTALIGVAEADLYPRFTLMGNFELQSIRSGDLFDARSRSYSFGPSLRWDIFSAGRIRQQILTEEARTEESLALYESRILEAVEEVESSMASIAHGWDRVAILQRAVASARETVTLVKDSYENGLVDFQRVLDAERTAFSAEDELAISRGQIAKHYITLYKALGGGSEIKTIRIPEASARARGGPLGVARRKTDGETTVHVEE